MKYIRESDLLGNPEEAEKILHAFNEKNNGLYWWEFDENMNLCIFGRTIKVDGSFSPPGDYDGAEWVGWLTINLCDGAIEEKEFNCLFVNELKEQVEKYIESYFNFKNLTMKNLLAVSMGMVQKYGH